MLADLQKRRGAPIGPNDSVITTQKYLAAVPSTQLESCSVASTTIIPMPLIDLEAVANITFPNVSQAATNMCSAFAFSQAYSLRHALQYPNTNTPRLSALFAYYFQRIAECTQTKTCTCPDTGACDPPCLDCGSYMNTAQAVFATGVCLASDWPYTTPLNTTPTPYAIGRSKAHRITKTTCVAAGNVGETQRALQDKCPVVVFLNMTPDQKTWMAAAAASVASRIEDVTLPAFSGTPSTVGHFVTITGTHASGAFLARNNFGRSWGFEGRFLIPYATFTPDQVFRAVRIDAVQ